MHPGGGYSAPGRSGCPSLGRGVLRHAPASEKSEGGGWAPSPTPTTTTGRMSKINVELILSISKINENHLFNYLTICNIYITII